MEKDKTSSENKESMNKESLSFKYEIEKLGYDIKITIKDAKDIPIEVEKVLKGFGIKL